MVKVTRVLLGTLLATLSLSAGVAQADDGDRHEGGDRHKRWHRAPTEGATLYEVTEFVAFDPIQGIEGPALSRNATATLLGFARIGTPLCPSKAYITNPAAETCTILGFGSDSIPLDTGKGPVSGTFAVVVNAPGNSSVHIPNLPVLTGTFEGQIDFSEPVLLGVPIGLIQGSFALNETGVTLPFTGTFRLPFALNTWGDAKEIEGEDEPAFYLADDRETLIRVRHNERNLGLPAVRLEVHFTR
jgi:hypothetical protein